MSIVKILLGNEKEDGCCGVEIIEIENKDDACCEIEKKNEKRPCCP
ncbi:hypothetical protein [Fictibacillus barbaricus]|uniref:Uncharacterized protein n=1 Tax=Fictibacillus barbaricus TaxID=182136 RepID=A0ABU1TV41_9BACL|nr:hypothetical protein [Fictibacillus barbaricus]MDR7071078.1 hypothetical protein [Fictibacillus barbaricus]